METQAGANSGKSGAHQLAGDILWGVIFLAWLIMLAVPATRNGYMSLNKAHEYLCGFLSFAVLATMGDLLAGKISGGKWVINPATLPKALVWGFIGMAIALFFGIMSSGVEMMQKAGMLPFPGNTFAHAFFTSALTNLSFGPAMFLFHKFTDAFIGAKFGRLPANPSALISRIDWRTFFVFTVFTMVPCFWIPFHTIVFMLPANLRVLVAAFGSVALGLILSLTKRSSSGKAPEAA